MGVIQSTRNTVVATLVIGVVALIGLNVLTKYDTSKDRQATVIVKLKPIRGRALAIVNTYINSAERSVDQIDENRTEFSETFWVRPGEKVSVSAHMLIDKGTLSCQILLDGVPVGPPRTTIEDYEVSCEASAVA